MIKPRHAKRLHLIRWYWWVFCDASHELVAHEHEYSGRVQ